MPPADAPHVLGKNQTLLHASTVSIEGHGVLIMGRSGAGKSALALELIAQGATLVSDDQTLITRADILIASPPAALAGLIEARFVGLLNTPYLRSVNLSLAIDLDQVEADRMPQKRSFSILNRSLPLLHGVKGAHFAPAIRLFVTGGGVACR